MIKLKKLITENVDRERFKNEVLKKTIRQQRPEYFHECPHCHEEIYEKHSYSDDGGKTMRHSDCGGLIEYYKTEQELKEIEEFYKYLGLKPQA
jgi:NAD-dependent SIR2 family protein deacetylase